MNRLALAAIASCLFILIGCEQAPPGAATTGGSGTAATPAASGTAKPAAAADHGHRQPAEAPAKPATEAPAEAKPGDGAGHGGAIIELGTTQIGDLSVRASRDSGELMPGGDAPIDVWLTTADGKPATVAAVRFWIGVENAKGSVKARADIEDPKQPHHWHTHAEMPNPVPVGAKLWVEIESTAGKAVGSFELME